MLPSHAFWKDTVPPSSVSLSVEAELGIASTESFGGKRPIASKQLVIAKANRLEVYGLETGDSPSLRLAHKIPLNGVVKSIGVIRTPGRAYDSLILSFPRAKLSVLRFNEAFNTFDTDTLYNFDDVSMEGGADSSVYVPILACDPKSRCAALAVSPNEIAVFPSEALGGSSERPKSIYSTEEPSGTVFMKDLGLMGITRVKDLKFLNGYLEPTILVLYEPLYTWEGRFAAKKHSYKVAALTIDLSRKSLSQICSSEYLPLQTRSILPCPLPLGGAFIFSSNVILHFDQHIDFALSLNEHGDHHEEYPVSLTKSPLITSIDNCEAIFVSPFIVLLNTNGKFYTMKIAYQGDAIQDIEISEFSEAVHAGSICNVTSDFIFVGSFLGDSALFKVTREETEVELPKVEPKEKIDELELQLFGQIQRTDQPEGQQLQTVSISFRLEEVDRLLNIGPISDFVIAPNPINDAGDKDLEMIPKNAYNDIVTTAGKGKKSYLHVLSDGVRPLVLGSFDFEKAVYGCWTLKSSGMAFDAFVVISFDDRTIVLSSENELQEMQDSGLVSDEQTIDLSSFNDDSLVMQVVPSAVHLYECGDKLYQKQSIFLSEICMDESIKITQACTKDHLAVMQLSDGSFRFVSYNTETDSIEVKHCNVPFPEGIAESGICAFSIFHDLGSGLFDRKEHELVLRTEENEKTEKRTETTDLEDFLFGTIETEMNIDEPERPENPSRASMPSYIGIVCRSDGSCSFIRLPDFELLFWIPNFPCGNSFIRNGLMNVLNSDFEPFEEFFVEEVMMTCFNNVSENCWLTASLSNGQVLLYKCLFDQYSHIIPLALQRYNHSLMIYNFDGSFHQKLRKRIFEFTDISGLKGFHISGNRPCWLFNHRGTFFEHFQSIRGGEAMDSGRGSFAPLNTADCNDGYISFCRGSLQVCQLPDPESIQFLHECPVQRVLVGETARWICYHKQSDTFSVVVSYMESTSGLEEVSERSLDLYKETFEIRLFTSGSFNFVESYKDIPENEIILSIEAVQLWDFTKNKLTEFIAVGTTIFEGEDTLCRGRVILFEIYDSTPSDLSGAGLSYKKIYDQTERASVVKIAEVQGVLCVCVGSRVIIYRFIESQLVGTAFFDSQLFPVSISTLKNFIVVGDVCKGVVFLYWESEMHQLIFLGKDYEMEEIYDTMLIPDGNTLRILASDALGNIRAFSYDPAHPSSRGGEKLLSRAEFHVGSRVSKFASLICRETNSSAIAQSDYDRRKEKTFMSMVSTIDGGLGYVVPVDELMFRKLFSLHTQMTFRISHVGGLNPKLFRTYSSTDPRKYEIHRSIVDGTLLWEFQNLNYFQQRALARNMGTKPESILQILQDIDLSARMF